MSTSVQVFLLEDVPSLGVAGDIVTVSEGYARNFLFSTNKATLVSSEVKAKKAKQEALKQQEEQAKLEEIQRIAEILEGKELTIPVQIKEGSEIYGSITAKKIAEELNTQANLDLKAKNVELKQPLTTVGEYKIPINLSSDFSATIVLTLVGESNPKTDEDEE